MSLFVEDLVDEIVNGINRGAETGFFDDDIEPVELDPVARITQETSQAASELPSALATPDPFDSPLDIDAMTSTLAERRQGRRTFQQSTPGSAGSFAAAQAATGMKKPTTGNFVNRMLAKEGLPYEWGFTGQPDPESGRKAFDCSGIINRIMQNFGFSNFPRVSGDIIAHAKPISLKKAINTRGAVLWTEGHIAVSLGNGKTIEARGEDYGVVIADAHGRFTKGGLLPELEVIAARKKRPVTSRKHRDQVRLSLDELVPKTRTESPTLQSINSPTAVFGSVMDEMEAPILKLREQRGLPTETSRKGILGQIYNGFMDAGREDLAKMVFTKDFKDWLGAESGMEVGNVSQPYDGIRNYGLFQFRRLPGRSWLEDYIKGDKFKASAYDQALLVTQYFDLSADDIRRYADEIRNDTYQGWG